MNPMKDSGVEWIGEIPRDWELIKTKYFTYMKGRIGWQGLKAEEFIDEGPYLVTGTDFINGKVNWETAYHISEERYHAAPEIQLQVGDLLVTKDGTVGKLALIDHLPDKASLNSHLLVIRPLKNKYLTSFFYYVLSSIEFENYFKLVSSGSTMDSLSQEKMGDFVFTLPNIPEQQTIADFLDEETKKLDDAKCLLQKQIEKLKEYRKSLIWETVTKGLDKSVPMKDSGVEWIGKIPSDWKLTRLKFITDGNLQYGANEEGIDYDENLPRYIRITDIDSNNNLKDSGKQSLSFNSAKPYILKKGDILFARSGATVGKTYLFQTDTLSAFAGYLIRYSPIENIESRFIYYMTLGSGYDNWKNSIFSQSTIQNIGADKYGNLPVVLPKDLEEQQAIADFLDEKTTIIEKIISNIQSQIEVIDKQKKTLIYDYVTGKRRVI